MMGLDYHFEELILTDSKSGFINSNFDCFSYNVSLSQQGSEGLKRFVVLSIFFGNFQQTDNVWEVVSSENIRVACLKKSRLLYVMNFCL